MTVRCPQCNCQNATVKTVPAKGKVPEFSILLCIQCNHSHGVVPHHDHQIKDLLDLAIQLSKDLDTLKIQIEKLEKEKA